MGAPEQLVQKTHMITCWADKMYEIVKRVRCMLPPSYWITSSLILGVAVWIRAAAGPKQVYPAQV